MRFRGNDGLSRRRPLSDDSIQLRKAQVASLCHSCQRVLVQSTGMTARCESWRVRKFADAFSLFDAPLVNMGAPTRPSQVRQPRPAPAAAGLLDVAEVAVRLGATVRFVRRLVAERRIPYVKVGKFVRFDPAEVEQWIDDHRVGQLRLW